MPFETYDLTDDPSLAFRHSSGGYSFQLPKIDATLRAHPAHGWFTAGLTVLGELIDRTTEIKNDNKLSDLGKAEKLEPEYTGSLRAISAFAGALEAEESDLSALEQKLLAVPPLLASDAAEAILDREVRDWWRSQPTEARNAYLQAMTTEGNHTRVELALLRSPIALLDHETQVIRESWNRRRRLSDPGQWAKIEMDRASVEWAKRGASHIAGMAKAVTKWPGHRILRALLDGDNAMQHRGASMFGFNQQDIAKTRGVMEAESHIARARAA